MNGSSGDREDASGCTNLEDDTLRVQHFANSRVTHPCGGGARCESVNQ